MADVYILYSKILNQYYIGSCKDVNLRFKEHLDKRYPNSFTAKVDDWILFYKITDLNSTQALKIEKHIKKMKSKTYIENIAKYPSIIEKLKLRYK